MNHILRPVGVAVADATDLILTLAVRQHGVVARRQLLASGVGPSLIEGRLANRRLIRVFPGVYSLGTGALGREGRWMASVLGAGEGALLSHRSAAYLHGLLAPGSGAIEVLRKNSEAHSKRSRPTAGAAGFSMVVRSTTRLPTGDVAEVSGIPVTSVARTLLDLAAVSDLRRTKSALIEAERLRAVSRSDLEETIERGRGWHGVKRLRRALNELDPTEAETRSDLEVEMLRLCREYRIPRPAVNVAVGDFVVDFLWREARLIAEVDGFEFHGSRTMFRRDRRRDVDLQLLGYRVSRFSHRDVVVDAATTAAKLKGLIALGPPR